MNNEISLYHDPDRARQNLILSGRSESVQGDDRVSFHALLTTLRRRRMLFLLVAAAVIALAIVLTLLQTPLYTSSAQVVIDSSKEQVTPVAEQVLQDGGELSSAAVDTEVQVILSSELANKVAEALHLDRSPMFDPANASPGMTAKLRSRFFGVPLPVPARAYDPAAQRQYVIDRLKAGLVAVRTGVSFSLTVSYSSPDPMFSTVVANEYARQYARQALERKQEANANALSFLSKRIDGLQRQAQADTEAVQKYRIAHNLLSSNASQLTEQEVATYDQQVAGARANAAEERARMQTAEQQLKNGSNGDDVGEALGSPVISSLKTQRAQLAGDLANLKTRYGPRHPDVQKAQSQLADLDRSIGDEVRRVISNLQARVKVSDQRLASISGSLGGARSTLTSNNRAMVGFDDLMRKAATSQALYETYLNRYKEAAAQEGTEKPDARVISWATVPGRPSSPNVVLNMVLAITLGVGAGLIAAFVAELAFSGLTTGDEVETRLGVRHLGVIPTLSSLDKKAPPPIDAIVQQPHGAFAEAVRSLRTALAYASPVHVQVVVVTSALPKEGKSTIAACLACVSVYDKEKVLLIDCDPHRRSVNRFVDSPAPEGLIEVLRGETSVEEALVKDEVSGVWVLPLNHTRLNPSDSLGGEAMEKLIDSLRSQFTYIVIDAAPILPVAEARSLATFADAVIFAVRWRKVSDHAVRSALKLLPEKHVNLAGVVLSRVDLRKQARFGQGDASSYHNHYREYYS